jgi:hypothetical protein
MIPPEQLKTPFQSNTWLLNRLLEGLSHAECLLTPDFQVNSINWIVGHMLVGRGSTLADLGRPLFWEPEAVDLYKTGSQPVAPVAALPIEQLKRKFDLAQLEIEESLDSIDSVSLQEIVETPFGPRPRWQSVSGLAWHETYHLGQIELLRQFALEQRAA